MDTIKNTPSTSLPLSALEIDAEHGRRWAYVWPGTHCTLTAEQMMAVLNAPQMTWTEYIAAQTAERRSYRTGMDSVK